MNQYFDTIFQMAQVNLYISELTECQENWGESNITLDYCKFYYFLGGQGTLIIGGDKYEPRSGELFLIPSGVTHSYSHNPKAPVYKYWCHFSLRFGELSTFTYHKNCISCIPSKRDTVTLFEKLTQAYSQRDPLARFLEKTYLLELCHLFLSNIPFENLFQNPQQLFLFQVSEYLGQHYKENLSITKIAADLHLQKNYFINKFTKNFGVSPIEYINTLKLEDARTKILQYPELSIEEIALSSGFQDYRYFSRLFKRRFGKSPRQACRENAMLLVDEN